MEFCRVLSRPQSNAICFRNDFQKPNLLHDSLVQFCRMWEGLVVIQSSTIRPIIFYSFEHPSVRLVYYSLRHSFCCCLVYVAGSPFSVIGVSCRFSISLMLQSIVHVNLGCRRFRLADGFDLGSHGPIGQNITSNFIFWRDLD